MLINVKSLLKNEIVLRNLQIITSETDLHNNKCRLFGMLMQQLR